MPNDFITFTPIGGGKHRAEVHLHKGQQQAMASTRRIVGVIAGTQSGKTVFGPHWLHREIMLRGPGDYMVVTPTFSLLELKALPEFVTWFQDTLHLGRYKASPIRKLEFTESGQKRMFGDSGTKYKTKIFFGYAADPESLESATAKAAWLDEAGQKRFKLGSYEAIRRRLSLHRGRILITTTPYNLGWLKQQIYDKWKAGDKNIDVVRFESLANPLFSREEWEDAFETLPKWKFDMFYRAIFTRPAGLIFDNFDEKKHTCPRFPIPDSWERFVGLDFGGVNTAATFYARDPKTNLLYLYRVYIAGSRSAAEHVKEILKGEPLKPDGSIRKPLAYGGSRSEVQWRREFRQGGLLILLPPISAVEVGIDRVYAAHQKDTIIVFDDLQHYLDEKLTYGRKLNESGEPTEVIEDKSSYHILDSERYIMSYLMGQRRKARNIGG